VGGGRRALLLTRKSCALGGTELCAADACRAAASAQRSVWYWALTRVHTGVRHETAVNVALCSSHAYASPPADYDTVWCKRHCEQRLHGFRAGAKLGMSNTAITSWERTCGRIETVCGRECVNMLCTGIIVAARSVSCRSARVQPAARMSVRSTVTGNIDSRVGWSPRNAKGVTCEYGCLHPAISRVVLHAYVQPVRGVSMLQIIRCSAPNRRGTTTCAVAVCSRVRGSRQSSLPTQ
jgi:hypothetical protein